VGQPKPKHPAKVHIWGAISIKGATSVVIFTETLTATRYTKILDAALLSFLRKHFPHRRRHRFQQDNDPKHISNFIKQYFKDHKVKWWKTPAESPDLNCIEKVWGSDLS